MTNEHIENERVLTDQCLHSERLKTDAALRRDVRSIEKTTDASLQNSRRKLRRDLIDDRAASDKFLRVGETVNVQLQEERRRVDERIDSQRQQADASLERERTLLQAEKAELLAHERLQTDASLCQERMESDRASSRSEELLLSEQAAHAVTKAAVTLRDNVLAIVSHDLQDPLSIIELCSHEFLGSCGEQRLTDLEIQWVETVRRHASTMFKLVTELLDVEYIASGKLQITPATCNMTVLVNEMVQNFHILAKRQKLTLEVDLPPVDVVIRADEMRVRQILANLISNALKFTPVAGTVVVRLMKNEKEALISVSDTGPGISKDDQQKIFDRFSQLDHQDRRGVGLGLFISKWMVEAHFGKIWLESTEGQGSTFFFTIPTTL